MIPVLSRISFRHTLLVNGVLLRYIHRTLAKSFSSTFSVFQKTTNIEELISSLEQQGNNAEEGVSRGKSANRFAKIYEKNGSRDAKDKHGSNNRHKKSGAPRPPQKRRVKFNLEGCLEQAKNALKSNIEKIFSLSKNYEVKFVNPETNKLERAFLDDIVNSLDLSSQGIFLVPADSENDVPLIKINKSFQMIKLYIDEIAAKREKELLEMGSLAAQRAVRQREKAEKKKSATKILTISWKISPTDLMNQKRAEIERYLSKGESFLLYVGDKRSLHSVRRSVDKEGGLRDKTASEEEEHSDTQDTEEWDGVNYELKKRELILQKIEEILNDAECSFELSGKVDSRIIASCTPKQKPTSSESSGKDENSDTKLLKKLRKQEKQKQKQRKEKEKASTKEEDLDALYLFKIDD